LHFLGGHDSAYVAFGSEALSSLQKVFGHARPGNGW
jgi:hypothetical protein